MKVKIQTENPELEGGQPLQLTGDFCSENGPLYSFESYRQHGRGVCVGGNVVLTVHKLLIQLPSRVPWRSLQVHPQKIEF